jgi:REP-associated tyrosine transposase
MSPRWPQDPELRRGRSVVFQLHVHLVFTTKYRRNVLTAAMLDRCEQVMGAVCADFGAQLAEFNGEDDHVHLLVTYPPAVALSRLVNSLKGVASRRLRQEFPEIRARLWRGHLWSPSYFAGSVGGAPLAVLRAYIQQQRGPG